MVLPVATMVTVAAGVNKQLLGHAVWLGRGIGGKMPVAGVKRGLDG